MGHGGVRRQVGAIWGLSGTTPHPDSVKPLLPLEEEGPTGRKAPWGVEGTVFRRTVFYSSDVLEV